MDASIPQTGILCVVSKYSLEVQNDHTHHMSISTPQAVIVCVGSKPATGMRRTRSHHELHHQDEMDHRTSLQDLYPAENENAGSSDDSGGDTSLPTLSPTLRPGSLLEP